MAHLLVIDDDEDFSSAVARYLRSEGYAVDVAADPDAGLKCLNQRLPDALVLDVMFPENPVAGFELARAIRRSRPDLPILMLTAVNQQFPLGFSGKDIDPKWLPVTVFLEKPVDFRLLSEHVRRLVAKQPPDNR